MVIKNSSVLLLFVFFFSKSCKAIPKAVCIFDNLEQSRTIFSGWQDVLNLLSNHKNDAARTPLEVLPQMWNSPRGL